MLRTATSIQQAADMTAGAQRQDTAHETSETNCSTALAKTTTRYVPMVDKSMSTGHKNTNREG